MEIQDDEDDFANTSVHEFKKIPEGANDPCFHRPVPNLHRQLVCRNGPGQAFVPEEPGENCR